MVRGLKQLIVLVISLVIVVGLGYGTYRLFIPAPPPPTPNPTVNLIPIGVISSKLLNVQNNDYDFVARVINRNSNYGSGNVAYQINFYDFNNQLTDTRNGSFYILPGQTKYILDSPLHLNQRASRADFQIKSVDWQQLDSLVGSGVALITKNVSFVDFSKQGQGVFAKSGGLVVNASDFDFNDVGIVAVAFDSSGEILAINRTNIRTFLAKTERGFEASWFSPFIGNVDHVDVEASTNIFDNFNLLRRFGGSERFQQIY